MKTISKLLFSGLVAVVPLTLTIYIFYWIVVTIEGSFGSVLQRIVPAEQYINGMGFVAGLIVLLTIGLLLKAWLFRRLFEWGEGFLVKLPLVKTLYNSLRDLMSFVAQPKQKELGAVVSVEMDNGAMMVGFLTQENPHLIHTSLPADKVAVYLPLSYQIGGHLVFMPKSKVKRLDMPMNEALRFTITAGMVKGG